MASKEKFPLVLKDGFEARNLRGLKENFDLTAILDYFRSGKLLEWLDARYYDEEAESVAELNKNDSKLSIKLCRIFGITCEDSELDVNIIANINAKKDKLQKLTTDDEVINNARYTAFDQEDLADLLDEGCEIIYLCGDEFTISARRVTNTAFIGILDTNPVININAESVDVLDYMGLFLKMFNYQSIYRIKQ